MRIIDRYITRSIAAVFILTMVIFALLFVLIDATSNLDEFIAQKAPLAVIARYYASFLPVVLVQTAAIACLIAVLFTYSNLNNHNEIIALRASGFDFWKVSRPAIAFAVLIAGLVFYSNERFAPQAQASAQKIRDEHLILEVDRKKKKSAKINYLTYYGYKNRLYCIDVYDPNTFEMTGITIHEYDDKMELAEKTYAQSGIWTGIAWKFTNVQTTTVPRSDDEDPRIRVFPEKLMDIKESPQDFLKQSLNVNSMNSRQLMDYIKRFSQSGSLRAINNLHVDLQEKFARPFAIIVIVLTGLPLALMVGRRKAQTFTSLAIAIALAFLYAIINSIGIAFGKGGFLHPLLAAWLAPFLFTGLAGYLILERFT